MKKFVLGFVLGAFVFSIMPIYAAVQDYKLYKSAAKITVNGTEYKNDNLPMLYLEPGYNYMPAALFRDICNAAGIGFNYDNIDNEIQLSTDAVKTKEVDNVGEITQAPDGVRVIKYKPNDENLILVMEFNYFYKNQKYYINTDDTLTFNKNCLVKDNEIILENLEIYYPDGNNFPPCFKYDYYIENIMPIVMQ